METKNSLWMSTKGLINQIISGKEYVVIEAARQSGLTTALLDYCKRFLVFSGHVKRIAFFTASTEDANAARKWMLDVLQDFDNVKIMDAKEWMIKIRLEIDGTNPQESEIFFRSLKTSEGTLGIGECDLVVVDNAAWCWYPYPEGLRKTVIASTPNPKSPVFRHVVDIAREGNPNKTFIRHFLWQTDSQRDNIFYISNDGQRHVPISVDEVEKLLYIIGDDALKNIRCPRMLEILENANDSDVYECITLYHPQKEEKVVQSPVNEFSDALDTVVRYLKEIVKKS